LGLTVAEGRKTVLVVEDEDVIRFLVHELLDYHGYDVLEASEGKEAFRLAQQHHPDLVLMDIELPEHSGLEVTRWLKEDDALKSIPVVAVTAYAMRGERQRMEDSGCDAYLAKPFSSNDFIATVERAIN